jgi:hypothetical protein
MSAEPSPDTPAAVLRVRDCAPGALAEALADLGLEFVAVPESETIEGSYWGDEEAGLVGAKLLARDDTPLHSVLHEACHFLCMDPERRAGLHTDAGGDYDEENAVCYLQILLAPRLPGMSRTRMCADMDAWGYSFRLGSAAAWFEDDAEDAQAWLRRRGLLDADGAVLPAAAAR